MGPEDPDAIDACKENALTIWHVPSSRDLGEKQPGSRNIIERRHGSRQPYIAS